MNRYIHISFFFFFNDTATTEIYTLSLHDALPIWKQPTSSKLYWKIMEPTIWKSCLGRRQETPSLQDRKSTRLNSSHLVISYAVFCLKKKKKSTDRYRTSLERITSSVTQH